MPPSILEVMGIPSGLGASPPAALPATEATSTHGFPRVGSAESALLCFVGGCGSSQSGTGEGEKRERLRIDDDTAVKILANAYDEHDAIAKLTDSGVYLLPALLA